MASSDSDGSLSRLQTKRSMTNVDNEEPATKTPRKPLLFLSSVPEVLLLKIFKKLPSDSRVRMRRTCSFMNSFVEENRQSLAKTYLHGGISIDIIVQNSVVVFKKSRRDTLPSFPMSNFKEMVSGLAIYSLTLYIKDDSPFDVVEEAFRNLNIISTFVNTTVKRSTDRCSVQQQLNFSNLVEAFSRFRFHLFSVDLVECVTFLHQSRNVKKFEVQALYSHPMDTDREFVQMMKNFKGFSFLLADVSFFKTFLWGIQSCSNCTLQYANFDFYNEESSAFDHTGYPSMKLLWDLSNFERHDTTAPFSVRLLSSSDQWITVSEHLPLDMDDIDAQSGIVVKFLDKGDEIGLLDRLIENIDLEDKFTPRMKEIYLKSDCEARFNMLGRAYFEQAKEDNILDQEHFVTYSEYLQKEHLQDNRNF